MKFIDKNQANKRKNKENLEQNNLKKKLLLKSKNIIL